MIFGKADPTSQKAYYVSLTKDKQLMPFREFIPVNCENRVDYASASYLESLNVMRGAVHVDTIVFERA
jgi:hypothetical protein